MTTQPLSSLKYSARVGHCQRHSHIDVVRYALWRKSSYSNAGECVSVARLGHELAGVRNSRCPEQGVVRVPAGVLAAWVAGCRAGEFDDLT
jgi:hypothetical protein